MKNEERNTKKIPNHILVWFLLDAIVALAPPIYWMADEHRMTEIFGLPATLFYFVSVAAFIVLSLVAAYTVEEKHGAFQ